MSLAHKYSNIITHPWKYLKYLDISHNFKNRGLMCRFIKHVTSTKSNDEKSLNSDLKKTSLLYEVDEFDSAAMVSVGR